MSDTTLDFDHAPGDLEAVISTAQEALAPTELETDVLYSVLNDEGGVEVLDLEQYREHPDRPRGTVKPATVESLSAYVEKHHDDEATTIWVHPTDGKIVAVLDDNAADTPNWREHRAELTLVRTDEWKFWLEGNGEFYDQQEFAERLQDGRPDIYQPEAAELLEIAQSIQGSANANFRNAVKLGDGAIKMQYDEEVTAKAGSAGELEIPDEFVLRIAPFVGNNPVDLTAQFRYRIRKGGGLSLGYKLLQPERAVRDAIDDIAEGLAGKFSRVYIGSPAE